MKEKRFLGKSYYQTLGLFAAALFLIVGSFFYYVFQSRQYLEDEMYAQAQAAAVNATHLLQNEVDTLKRITSTVALLGDDDHPVSEQEIVEKLKLFADKGVLARIIFITLDGHAYTNYAGYLGQSEDNLKIGDLWVKDITTATVMQCFYSDSFQQAIFGVATKMHLGQHEGILISSYNVNEFYDTLKSDFLQGAIQTGIVSQDGKVILGKCDSEYGLDIFTDINGKGVRFTKGSAVEMQQDFRTGESGIVSYKTSGEKRYIAYMPTGINDWYVTTLIPEYALRVRIIPIQKNGSLLAIKLIGIMAAVFVLIMLTHQKEEKRIKKILKDAAMYDGLTRIYNRAATERKLIEFFSDSARDGQHCMFILDIDSFKDINDTYGHIAGDAALAALADKLQQFFGPDAIVGRLGGDEFLVFRQNYESREDVIKMAELIIKPITVEKYPQMPPISVSMGISLYPRDGISFIELYQCADDALYEAKRSGKSGFVFCDKSDSEKEAIPPC